MSLYSIILLPFSPFVVYFFPNISHDFHCIFDWCEQRDSIYRGHPMVIPQPPSYVATVNLEPT